MIRTLGITTILAACLMLALNTIADAEMIGPGANPAWSSADSGGQRMNITYTVGAVALPAGTYDVDDFAYTSAGANGSVTPLLAIRNGSADYTTVWFGDAFAPGATGVQTTTYAAGTQQFTLAAETELYAGVHQQEPGVGFTGGGNTDHSNNQPAPTSVGESLTSFGHAGLGRTYAYEINVSPAVPEPSTLVLGLLALLGVMGGALRRRRAR